MFVVGLYGGPQVPTFVHRLGAAAQHTDTTTTITLHYSTRTAMRSCRIRKRAFRQVSSAAAVAVYGQFIFYD